MSNYNCRVHVNFMHSTEFPVATLCHEDCLLFQYTDWLRHWHVIMNKPRYVKYIRSIKYKHLIHVFIVSSSLKKPWESVVLSRSPYIPLLHTVRRGVESSWFSYTIIYERHSMWKEAFGFVWHVRSWRRAYSISYRKYGHQFLGTQPSVVFECRPLSPGCCILHEIRARTHTYTQNPSSQPASQL